MKYPNMDSMILTTAGAGLTISFVALMLHLINLVEMASLMIRYLIIGVVLMWIVYLSVPFFLLMWGLVRR